MPISCVQALTKKWKMRDSVDNKSSHKCQENCENPEITSDDMQYSQVKAGYKLLQDTQQGGTWQMGYTGSCQKKDTAVPNITETNIWSDDTKM